MMCMILWTKASTTFTYDGAKVLSSSITQSPRACFPWMIHVICGFGPAI